MLWRGGWGVVRWGGAVVERGRTESAVAGRGVWWSSDRCGFLQRGARRTNKLAWEPLPAYFHVVYHRTAAGSPPSRC